MAFAKHLATIGVNVKTERTAEILARLTQTGRSLTPGEEGRDTSGKALKWSDIAAAVSFANLTEVQYLYVLSVFAHDVGVQSEMYYKLEVRAIDIAARQRWKLDVGLFRRMVRLAIGETLFASRCPVCRGVGSLQASPPIPCEACNSSGWVKLNDGKRAAILEIHPRQYSRVWKDRYASVITFIQADLQESLRKVGDAIQ